MTAYMFFREWAKRAFVIVLPLALKQGLLPFVPILAAFPGALSSCFQGENISPPPPLPPILARRQIKLCQIVPFLPMYGVGVYKICPPPPARLSLCVAKASMSWNPDGWPVYVYYLPKHAGGEGLQPSLHVDEQKKAAAAKRERRVGTPIAW